MLENFGIKSNKSKMRKIISLVICLGFALTVHGQYKVQFILKEKTIIQHDSIYITGSFNNWDSIPNKDYLLKPSGENEKSIVTEFAQRINPL